MRALVTGSGGFLGRHFKSELVRRGYQVIAVEINDPAFSCDAMQVFTKGHMRVDLAIHCAALSPHRQAIDADPLRVGAYNLMLDAALFDWAARVQPDHLVYISSSAAYPAHLQNGSNPVDWLTEFDIDLDHRVIGNPDAIYGWTKLTGEQLANRYQQAGGRATVVRPFTGYGTDQSSRFPFGAFRDRANRRDDPFEVWGSGEQVRDFIHVKDLVAATMRAVELRVAGPINLCTGVGTSMLELAELFCEAAGYSPRIETKPGAPGGVQHRVGDPTLLHEFYIPSIDIRRGVSDALAGR